MQVSGACNKGVFGDPEKGYIGVLTMRKMKLPHYLGLTGIMKLPFLQAFLPTCQALNAKTAQEQFGVPKGRCCPLMPLLKPQLLRGYLDLCREVKGLGHRGLVA